MAGTKARGKVVKKAANPRVAAKPKAAKRRRDPIVTDDVTAAVVDQVPPLGYDLTNRSTRYARVMADVRQKVGAGKPVIMATFVGRAGATQVKRALEAGERPVDGRVEDWVFDARRDADGGSTLYCTLIE